MKYTLKDIMMFFDLKERTVRRHIKEGKLNGEKVGGVWQFCDNDIKRYFNNPIFMKQRRKKQLNRIVDYLNGFMERKNHAILIINKFNMSHQRMQEIVTQASTTDEPFKLDVEQLGRGYSFIFESDQDSIKRFIDILEGENI